MYLYPSTYLTEAGVCYEFQATLQHIMIARSARVSLEDYFSLKKKKVSMGAYFSLVSWSINPLSSLCAFSAFNNDDKMQNLQ